jgi:hypothetical protein
VGLPACAGLVLGCDLRSLNADIFVSDDADLAGTFRGIFYDDLDFFVASVN